MFAAIGTINRRCGLGIGRNLQPDDAAIWHSNLWLFTGHDVLPSPRGTIATVVRVQERQEEIDLFRAQAHKRFLQAPDKRRDARRIGGAITAASGTRAGGL
ncbi:MAG: hypothetical protein ABJB10_20320, partial [Mesorhizobium sp.]